MTFRRAILYAIATIFGALAIASVVVIGGLALVGAIVVLDAIFSVVRFEYVAFGAGLVWLAGLVGLVFMPSKIAKAIDPSFDYGPSPTDEFIYRHMHGSTERHLAGTQDDE